MASNSSTPPFDPTRQTSFILYADGQTQVPFNTAMITLVYTNATSLSILYGTQIGACIVMLAVVLAMTPRARFKRTPTLISVAALTLNLIRMLLLALFFTSTWVNFYTVVSGDASPIPRADYNTSAVTTALSVPVTILILAALVVQAWSMMRLWPAKYRVPTTAMSLALVLTTVGFNFATTIFQTQATLYADMSYLKNWVRQAYLGLITASICWFCFLFNIRLVMHMWVNRSVLPSLQGLKAMDVLVITNGILMFVPVVFSALEFVQFSRFEAASLTQTSVIIVLPLGTLVAQRLANPAAFGTGPGSEDASGHSHNHHHHRTGDMSSTTISNARSGLSTATTTTTKRPLLWSMHNNNTSGVHRGGDGGAVVTHIASDGSTESSEKGRVDHHHHVHHRHRHGDVTSPVDAELADLERGNGGGGGVRVNYGIERREERVPSGSS